MGVNKRFKRLDDKIKLLDHRLSLIVDTLQLLARREKSICVVPRLSGGLGNQLFQIAASYAMAKKIEAEHALHYGSYLPVGEGQSPSVYKDNLYQKIKETAQVPPLKYQFLYHRYEEVGSFFLTDVELEGFFQSRKYFSGYEEEIRQLFVIPPRDQRRNRWLPRPRLPSHRRDPCPLGRLLEGALLTVCTPLYYQRALRQFPKEYRMILCSDQPEKAAEMVGDIPIEIFRGKSELSDLVLLSQCDNLILSNSTFSYRAYFLGKRKQKVIAPSYWFHPDHADTDLLDIYEPEWIKISPVKSFWDFFAK